MLGWNIAQRRDDRIDKPNPDNSISNLGISGAYDFQPDIYDYFARIKRIGTTNTIFQMQLTLYLGKEMSTVKLSRERGMKLELRNFRTRHS